VRSLGTVLHNRPYFSLLCLDRNRSTCIGKLITALAHTLHPMLHSKSIHVGQGGFLTIDVLQGPTVRVATLCLPRPHFLPRGRHSSASSDRRCAKPDALPLFQYPANRATNTGVPWKPVGARLVHQGGASAPARTCHHRSVYGHRRLVILQRICEGVRAAPRSVPCCAHSTDPPPQHRPTHPSTDPPTQHRPSCDKPAWLVCRAGGCVLPPWWVPSLPRNHWSQPSRTHRCTVRAFASGAVLLALTAGGQRVCVLDTLQTRRAARVKGLHGESTTPPPPTRAVGLPWGPYLDTQEITAAIFLNKKKERQTERERESVVQPPP
jgi:hypothetical protein